VGEFLARNAVRPSGVISSVEPCEVHNARGVDHNWGFLNFIVPLEVAESAAAEISDSEKLPGFAQRVIFDREMARRLVRLHARLEESKDHLARQSATVFTLTDFFRRHSTVRPSTSGATPRHTVQRARELLQDSYADRISLRELSTCAGLSPFHFLRVFVHQFGLTPHAYLNQIRVREAKRKLSSGAPCAQVALDCGFCDQSHLARVFKRSTGVTPSRYQSAHTKRAAL
jgi:AraC-like DNA-binding protein